MALCDKDNFDLWCLGRPFVAYSLVQFYLCKMMSNFTV